MKKVIFLLFTIVSFFVEIKAETTFFIGLCNGSQESIQKTTMFKEELFSKRYAINYDNLMLKQENSVGRKRVNFVLVCTASAAVSGFLTYTLLQAIDTHWQFRGYDVGEALIYTSLASAGGLVVSIPLSFVLFKKQ